MRAITNPNEPNHKLKAPQSPRPWRKWVSLLVAIALAFYLTACGESEPKPQTNSAPPAIKVTEVAPPLAIQKLARQMEKYEPKLTILSPKSDEVLTDNQVSVKFAIQNLPIFKSSLGLGPHVHVALDTQEYQAVYDINQPIVFDHLSPGTHTLRAFASRPWHESFKNNGAYTQLTFHVLTKTNENTPDPKLPLLTYSRPVGTYGAEPIMLDFYLHNAPLHLAAQADTKVGDWQVRATLNGQTFTFDQWQPVYLKGFHPGQNWVKLELVDTNGALIPNAFNSSAHVINYQPGGQDTLAKLVRDEAIADIESVVNPDYVPPTPTPSPTPTPAASPAQSSPAVAPNASSANAPSANSPSAVASPAETPVSAPKLTVPVVAPVIAPVVVPVVPANVSSPAVTTPAAPTPEPVVTPRKKVILRKPVVEPKSEPKPETKPESPVKSKPAATVAPVATPVTKTAEPVTAPKVEPKVEVKVEVKSTANPVIVPVKLTAPAKVPAKVEVKPVDAPTVQPSPTPAKPAIIKPVLVKPAASPAKDEKAKTTDKTEVKPANEASEPKSSPAPKAAPVLTTKPKLEFKVEKRSEFTPAPKSVTPVAPAKEISPKAQEAPKSNPAPEATPSKPAHTNYFWEQLQQQLHPESATK